MGGEERERECREKWKKRIWTGKEIEKKGIEIKGVSGTWRAVR